MSEDDFPRVKNEYSLHDQETVFRPDGSLTCPGFNHNWRTLVCGDEAGEGRDIVECSRCGQQRNVRCTFDDEYC